MRPTCDTSVLVPALLPFHDRHRDALRHLAAVGIKGGAVYDGLVGMTARTHGRTRLTFDRRALPAYDAVGVDLAVG